MKHLIIGWLLFASVGVTGSFLCRVVDNVRIDDANAQEELVMDLYGYAYYKGELSALGYLAQELQHQYIKKGGE